MGPADSRRITRVPRYSGYRQAPSVFMYRIVTFCDATFQMLPFHIRVPQRGPTTPGVRCHTAGLGCSPVARHYWGNHCCFLLLEVLRCFSSLRSPPYTYVRIITLQVIGLSHSETPGSMDICSYPGLIAACHVLHRLREPRHPPCALDYFRLTLYHPINKRHSSYFQLLIDSIFIYSLACVNMSKNSSPEGDCGE